MTSVRGLLQSMIRVTRHAFRHEFPGWGKAYFVIVGDYRRNDFWRGAGVFTQPSKIHGFRQSLDISGWNDRSNYFLGRWYDEEALWLCQQVLTNGDIVLDVGANVGNFTLAALHRVGAEGTVISVEPNPAMVERLRKDIALNGIKNVEVHQVASGAAETDAVLTIPKINSGEASLAGHNYSDNEVDTVSVPVTTGDILVSGRPLKLIKIDVEGAELEALKGLRETILASTPVVYVECVESYLNRFGTSCRELFEHFADLGYELFTITTPRRLSGSGGSVTPLDRQANDLPNDILCVHTSDEGTRAKLGIA